MYVSNSIIPVRYAETDMMKIVHHSSYILYLELSRTNLIKEIGFDYLAMEEEGYVSPVLNVDISYKMPLKYGQNAVVMTWIEEYNGVRIKYGYNIYNNVGELCAVAFTTHTVVDQETFKPINIKKVFPEWHKKYEEVKKKSLK